MQHFISTKRLARAAQTFRTQYIAVWARNSEAQTMCTNYVTLVPAYGRDYKSQKEVKAAWEANVDFLIQSVVHPDNGRYINRKQAEESTPSVTYNIRFKQLRNVCVITAPKGKRNRVSTMAIPEGNTWFYKGHTIIMRIDRTPDNRRNDYLVVAPDGKQLRPRIDPYADESIVELWIDAGCPAGECRYENGVLGPWQRKDLEKLVLETA